MNCKNCGAVINSSFCPDCGQKADLHRISIKHLLHDVVHAVTHADKGFLLLIKELFRKPGIVAKEYVDGRRKRYFNPLSFLVITSAILAYLSHKTGYLDALSAGQRAGGGQMSMMWAEAFKISENAGKELTLILMAPLFAFMSWLFFIRARYNFAENFVLNAYLMGQAALVRSFVFIPIHIMLPQFTKILLFTAYEPLFVVYLAIAYKQFFGGHTLVAVLKAVLARIIWIVLFWVIILGYVYLRHLLI